MTRNSYSDRLTSLSQLAKLQKAKELTEARKRRAFTFTSFKSRFWPQYVHTPFHDIIDQHLTKVFQYLTTGEGISRLMVFMPPQYGKSRNISQLFPAWVLGNEPNIPCILASYGSRLAERNSRAVRNIIQRREYMNLYPNTILAPDRSSAQEWKLLDAEGGVTATGVGGGITGFSGRLIIIDDPIRSRADAESAIKRENVHHWYTNDLYTRLVDLQPSAIILFNTRWHHDDLAGWLLDDNVDDWTVLSFPALATEKDDLLGRAIGEPLWPLKHTKEDLERIASQLGDYAFSSLFQQEPQETKGRLFDTAEIEEIDYIPEIKQAVRFYDLATTKKSQASYTVGLKLGMTYDNRPIVLDVYRVQAEMPDVHQAIKQNARLDGTDVPIILETEKGGIIELQYLHRDSDMNGYTMSLQTPEGDKYTRATPIASKVNAGRLLMVKAQWNRAFLDELSVFNKGKWDDQVDALSGAYKALTDRYTTVDNSDISEFLANYRGLVGKR